MPREKESRQLRLARHARVRRRVAGAGERPRLCVFRSLRHIYAQVTDDTLGHTLVAASSVEPSIRDVKSSGKREKAGMVGALVAQRAVEKEITTVVFDRGGYKYHGRVKALAEAVREGGLNF